jgi:myo-inositol-1(or 4)-monophosphatase
MNSKELAIRAVKEAGEILKDNFNKHYEIKSKTPHDFVTEIDKKAEKRILEIIAESGYSVLSEEAGEIKKESDYEWIVDPLDGTTNYILGSPVFASSIALLHKRDVILSAVFVPMTGDLFVAEKSKGAFLNGSKIHVSDVDKLEKSFLIFCHGKEIEFIKKSIEIYSKFKLRCKDMRQFGSAAIELATVASGKAEAFIIPGTPRWDTAPGFLIVKEAGGKITDFQGNEWDVTRPDLVASNGKIHDIILNIMSEK